MMERLLNLPDLASEHGGRLDHATELVHWLMLALFVIWGLLFIFILFRFRQGRNPKASYKGIQSHISSYGEVGVAVVEAIILIGFSIPLYSERVDDVPDASESTVVRVIGEQFVWNMHYPGPDGVFGATRPELVDTESNPVGLDRDDPAAKDDVTTINQLHLPVGKPAVIQLSSKDVIHSFYIVAMRIKQDAIPGMQFPVWFEPTVTTAEMREKHGDGFNYEIGCSQLCGIGHSTMKGIATIHTQEEWDAWMEEEQSYLGDDSADDFWG